MHDVKHTFLARVAAQLFALATSCALAANAMAAAIAANAPADVAGALRTLPQVEVMHTNKDGLPTLLRGNLGQAPQLDAADLAGSQRTMRAVLAPALGALRLQAADLRLRKIGVDVHGTRTLRYDQTHNGLDVIGGDLVVQVDGKGRVTLMTGTARGDIPATASRRDIGDSAVHAAAVTDARYAGMQTTAPRKVYFMAPADGAVALAYETVVSGARGQDPVRDKVYVSVETGAILGVHPQIHFAENRMVYNASGQALPGALKRAEGGAAISDVDVNAAYDGSGNTYEAYKKFWNRDSYNDAGATLTSAVHYSRNYCNAFWDGRQMVYGDGDSSRNCQPLARAQDVTAHELTHAVTNSESNLTYSGESGGINEAMSDIFGTFTEAFVNGGKTGKLTVDANTWKIGELVIAPALRYMNDPAADGVSLDFYTSTAGNVDVHYSSGIANLAFYLLSQGGKHPRGKSTIAVTGLGMDKAIRVFYETNVNLLTSNATFLNAANATVQAAVNLGYTTAQQASVADAWRAVGVTAVVGPTNCTTNCGGNGIDDVVLTNGMAITGIGGPAGSEKYFKLVVPAGQPFLTFAITGGTGDVDLHTKLGDRPALGSYNCRPYLTGNEEKCKFASPAAGTYYVLLNGYDAYAGVTLTGLYGSTGGDGTPVLTRGVAVTGISGAADSAQYWMVSVPAGQTLTVAMSGGSGDADLYVRADMKPTTAAYGCRPYTAGNTETCVSRPAFATDYYVMLHGYTAFSGVSLKASY